MAGYYYDKTWADAGSLASCYGGRDRSEVELKASREALERTLNRQLFSGPNGRYYLKGNAQSPVSSMPKTQS